MKYLVIGSLLVSLAATAASAGMPTWFAMERICEDAGTQLQVTVWNWVYGGDPLPDVEFTVVRRTTVPGLADPVTITETPLPLPAFGESETYLLPDPDVPIDGIGYYEGWVTDEGFDYLSDEFTLACVEHPYLIRGRLITEYEVAPCEGIGLMECTVVSIVDAEFMQYVGTGEMLDIYGWPVWIIDVDQCGIIITDIVPLGEGATCSDPVGTQSRSWSSVKGLFE